jgi:hypothetical protein
MTLHDANDDESPADETGDADKKPADLRFTKVEQSGVRLERDMSGQGHLARGSRTNMSNMRFSVRAQPRAELDPELQALRPTEPVVPAQEVETTPVSDVEKIEPPSSTPEKDAGHGGGMFGAIRRLFS